MMTSLYLLLGIAWAGDTLIRPSPPVAVPGECRQSFPLSVGKRPDDALVSDDNIVLCSGVLVPTSQVGYLLATEAHRDAIEDLHLQDITILQRRIDELESGETWKDNVWLQRTIGGAFVGVLAAGFWISYNRGVESD